MPLQRKTTKFLVCEVLETFRYHYKIPKILGIRVQLVRTRRAFVAEQARLTNAKYRDGEFCLIRNTAKVFGAFNLTKRRLVQVLCHELIHWWQKNICLTLSWAVVGNGVAVTWMGKPTDHLPWAKRPQEIEANRLGKKLAQRVIQRLGL